MTSDNGYSAGYTDALQDVEDILRDMLDRIAGLDPVDQMIERLANAVKDKLQPIIRNEIRLAVAEIIKETQRQSDRSMIALFDERDELVKEIADEVVRRFKL